jgi:FtsH-binding integral membrane protein
MNKSEKTLRDKLVDMEKPNANYREEYEKEVRAMFEKKLTGLTRTWAIVGLIMGLGFFILFGSLAVIVPREFPLWGRFIWALGAVFGLGFAGLETWVLKKGAVNLKTDNMAMAGLGWAFVVIVASIILVFSARFSDPMKGVRALIAVLIFLVLAAVCLLKAFIQRSEVNTREKLLEIEYRLAELAEKMEGKLQE